MLASYFPVLVFICIALFIGVIALGVGRLLSPKNSYKAKNYAYECGFDAFSDARMPFDVRYYLVAILFIIFDRFNNCNFFFYLLQKY